MDSKHCFTFSPGAWVSGTAYRVVRSIGLGGMGEVYEVAHSKTGTRRALKVARCEGDDPLRMHQRLAREGRLLRCIVHPNVVRVHEIGVLPDGRTYFFMELLSGASLRTEMTRGPMPLERVVTLMVQVLRGLELLHNAGVVHRDVKPANVFVCRNDVVKLLDLGIAKHVDGCASAALTCAGSVLGTAQYMAPEQLLGRCLDPRADLYSVALVIFEALAGQHPFAQGGRCEILRRTKFDAPALSAVCSSPVPESMDRLIATMLCRDPDGRIERASTFAEALLQSLRETSTWARSDVFAFLPTVLAHDTDRTEPDVLMSGDICETDDKPDGGVAETIADEAAVAEKKPRGADWRDVGAWCRIGVAAALLALALSGVAMVIALRGTTGKACDHHRHACDAPSTASRGSLPLHVKAF